MRRAALLIVVGLLLFLTSPPVDGAPMSRLGPAFRRLGAERISYRGYLFLQGDDRRMEGWERRIDQNRTRLGESRGRLRLVDLDNGEPGTGENRAFLVSGRDYRVCRDVLQASAGLGEPPAGSAAWLAEGFLVGDCSDLPRLAEEIVGELKGRIHSVYRDKATLNLVAYVPGLAPELIIEGAPVNFNLELRYDQYRDRIRIRAGVPVLISNLGV